MNRFHNVDVNFHIDSESDDDSNEFDVDEDIDEIPELCSASEAESDDYGRLSDENGHEEDEDAMSTASSLPELHSDDSDMSDGDYTDDLDDDYVQESDSGGSNEENEFEMSTQELGIFQLLSEQIGNLQQVAPNFFTISLRMLYDRLMSNLDVEDYKNTPTKEAVLKNLPSLKVDTLQVEKGESCCICFGDYSSAEEVITLPCNHRYHSDCVMKWLKLHSTCPNCRLDLNALDSNVSGMHVNEDMEI